MRLTNSIQAAVLTGGCILMIGAVANSAEVAAAAKSSAAAPCMNVLDRFTAADVPALGPAEAEAPAGKWTSGFAAAADLPGKGMSQHPMLYAGEGYNKMFLVRISKKSGVTTSNRPGPPSASRTATR